MRGVICLLVAFLVCGCSASKEVVYWQDMASVGEITASARRAVVANVGDQLKVVVYGENDQLANAFNLVDPNSAAGVNGTGTQAYTIDERGEIKMPVLGTISVGGKTREQIATAIEKELSGRNLLNKPVVNVEIKGLYVNVLGEVNDPKRVEFTKDVMTLTEALAECGDLTISGKRDNIMVVREIGGKKKLISVDMRSAKSVYESEAYYLQPNDEIYVEPTMARANQSTVNGNLVRTPTFWISLVSIALTIALFLK